MEIPRQNDDSNDGLPPNININFGLPGEQAESNAPLEPSLNPEDGVMREISETSKPIPSFDDFYENPETIPAETVEKVKKSMWAAIDWAPPFETRPRSSHIDTSTLGYNNDDVVSFKYLDNADPWLFIASSEEEYNAALAATSNIARKNPDTLRERDAHLEEHSDALREIDPDVRLTLGIEFRATSVRSGNRLRDLVKPANEKYKIEAEPFVASTWSKTMTKLELAAALAHPERPSQEDIETLQTMGYDPKSLISHIDSHNSLGGKQIPYPKWYKR